MARPIRVEYPGAVYHVTARGNERRKTYRDDTDREEFLRTLEETVKAHDLRLHGFCLMPNHYHLLVETPLGNLSRAIGWLQTTYSIRFNRRHRRSGHLFQGRFKAQLVEADSYATELLRYVHLNPVRPRDKSAPVPASRRADLAEYPWSSHRAYLGRRGAPSWLCTDWLSFFAPTTPVARRRYARFVADAFETAIESPWDGLRHGLALGTETFTAKVAQLLRAKPTAEEVRWVARAQQAEKGGAVGQALAREQTERPWQVWVRVRLGRERSIDVARSYGYKDGSAITQILKRLDRRAQNAPEIRSKMAGFETKFQARMSSIES